MTKKRFYKPSLKQRGAKFQLPYFVQGILIILCALLFFFCLISFSEKDASKNWLGLFGYVMGYSFLYLFGLAGYLIPIFTGWLGGRILFKKPIGSALLASSYFFIFLLSCSVLLAMAAHHFPHFSNIFENKIHSDYFPSKAFYDPAKLRHYLGGVPLHHLYVDTFYNLHSLLGGLGTFFFSLTSLISSAILLLEIPLSFFYSIGNHIYNRFLSLIKPKARFANPRRPSPSQNRFEPIKEEPETTLSRENPLKHPSRIKFAEQKPKQTTPPQMPTPFIKGDGSTFQLPHPSILTEAKLADQSSLKNDLKRHAVTLEETLASFGIEAKVGDIHCGPTITSFEVHPAVGVKVQKIKALENDLALNLQAKSIRIIAPIPGKAAVGIEVPNPFPQEVGFRELLENYQSGNKKAHIPLLLGKMVNGEQMWADLTKMPHLIIAGATGSGKSVCINTIVMSIVMNAPPDEIKLVMVDPKKVELTAYTHLPHMLSPVITEPGGASAALNWLVKEMERRYEIFRLLGIRNIHGFNARKINPELEGSLDLEIPEKMPFIVVIIDELADLMMISSSDIETPIARIAQMARAVGIHMILATQRPSREVITGLIKANFPCRLAFKVSSRVNSQIIMDENGAETLLGNGDMLFLPPGTSSLVRAQGAFIRDDDINRVIHFICSQASTNYLIPSFEALYERSSEEGPGKEMIQRDTLYEEAKKLVLETGTASTTFIQRKLKVGYARAAGLMDQLEDCGVIGPSEGAKPRKIFYPQSTSEDTD